MVNQTGNKTPISISGSQEINRYTAEESLYDSKVRRLADDPRQQAEGLGGNFLQIMIRYDKIKCVLCPLRLLKSPAGQFLHLIWVTFVFHNCDYINNIHILNIYIYDYFSFDNHTFSHPGSAIAQDALRRRMEAAWRGTVE